MGNDESTFQNASKQDDWEVVSVPTTPTLGENYIDRIPEEILVMIFDYIHSSDKNTVCNMTLVCQRWRYLIERFHMFEESRFFEKRRNIQEYLFAQNSRRHFKSFKMALSSQKDFGIEWIEKIFEKHGKLLKTAYIEFGHYENILSALLNIQGFTFQYFYRILRVLCDLEELTISFAKLDIDEDESLNNPKIVFKNLKSLKIYWKNGKTAIAKFLLNHIETPSLRELKIEMPTPYRADEGPMFYKFMNENSKFLEKVYIWSPNYHIFDWRSDFLEIWCRNELKPEIYKFMENRKANLKVFKCHWMQDSTFISQIFDAAHNLEHFETCETASYFCGHRKYFNIKMLTLWYFWDDMDIVERLHFTFPNIEILILAEGQLSEENYYKFRELFKKLTKIQMYDPTSETYTTIDYPILN